MSLDIGRGRASNNMSLAIVKQVPPTLLKIKLTYHLWYVTLAFGTLFSTLQQLDKMPANLLSLSLRLCQKICSPKVFLKTWDLEC